MSLSICIPVLNDNEELDRTVSSIRATSPADVEIIIVDDSSINPVKPQDGSCSVIRLKTRLGAGRARHIAALASAGKFLLLLDAHMRFVPGWYESMMNRMALDGSAVWCTSCPGLDKEHANVMEPVGVYTGANLVLHDPKSGLVFEGVWKSPEEGDDYEVPCLMGGAYFVRRDWFFKIGGLEHNRMWGSEEPSLSIRTWLAGGSVRLAKDVRIGHMFRSRSPYATDMSYLYYNKLRAMKTMFPNDAYEYLKSKMPADGSTMSALRTLAMDPGSVEIERRYNLSIAKFDLDWLCQKFNISQPWMQYV